MMYTVSGSETSLPMPMRGDPGQDRCAGQPANAELRELVASSGLPSAVAMTIFNRGLGAMACTETQWKGFLAEPGAARFLPLSEAQFAHAVDQFARIGFHREPASPPA